jgi:amino acid adenylation domain-containing protein
VNATRTAPVEARCGGTRNTFADSGSLHRLVMDSAARYPDRVAISAPDGQLAYGLLDRRANALARRLAALGVGHGDRVVIWTEKSCAGLVAMQATLRLGAVYVPLDGATPVARAALVARDCAAKAVCVPPQRMARICAELGETVGYVDLEHDVPADGDPARVNRSVDPDDLAYILYTSGSTGTPKGVCISHRNARSFVDWAVTELAVQPEDRLANHAPLTFDLSVLDIYAAFAAGASVHLVPTELAYAPSQLVEFLRERRITIWYSVPSVLTLMMRGGGLLDAPAPDVLRAVLFAGEPFPIPHVRRLAGWTGARLLNLYGPTETNVCTFHEVVPADLERDRPVPIGKASCGDTVWAATPDGRPAGPGEEGELLVDGPTVMAGYWGREPHRGTYATGDLVRVLPDGSFDYVGRRDHMVKVRGHRIELGEVEATLMAHPDVGDAAVVVTGEGIYAALEAFVVPAGGRAPGVLALKRHSAQSLPTYMIVDRVHLVAELPRTRNGKVDRAKLAGLAGKSATSENVS